MKLDVYNVQGAFVRRLVDEYQSSGYYRVSWDGKTSGGLPASSGVYFGHLYVDKTRYTIRMQLLK